MKYESTGKLSYKNSTWISLIIDNELVKYYRSTVFAKDGMQIPMHGAHITVVNGNWEVVPNRELWNKYEGENVTFSYDGDVKLVRGTWFMYCNSPRIEEIRVELGLTSLFANRPLHFTIGKIPKSKVQREQTKLWQKQSRDSQKKALS